MQVLDNGMEAIAGASERLGFENLNRLANDLYGLVGLLHDRMARVQEILTFLTEAVPVLETMVGISAVGLDRAQVHSEDLFARLAGTVPEIHRKGAATVSETPSRGASAHA